MRYNDNIITTAPGKRSTITRCTLNIAANGAFWHGLEGEDVSYLQVRYLERKDDTDTLRSDLRSHDFTTTPNDLPPSPTLPNLTLHPNTTTTHYPDNPTLSHLSDQRKRTSQCTCPQLPPSARYPSCTDKGY